MFNNVVIGVKELQAAGDALSVARILTSTRSNLTLAHVQVVAPKPAPDSGAATTARHRRRALERLTALCAASRVDAELVYVEARDAREGLYGTVRARDADLLVIGASRYDVIYRDLVGDDVRELLGNPPCAVAIAPLGYADQPGQLRTIGVAYDASPASAQALGVAKELALDAQAELSLVHAVDGLGRHDPVLGNESFEDEMRQVGARIHALTGIEAHVEDGDPAQELRRYGRSVDLLVLGAHRHGPIGRFLGRGTVRLLADEPPCPLLVLPQAHRAPGAEVEQVNAGSRKTRDD